jgi:hypothetical protein
LTTQSEHTLCAIILPLGSLPNHLLCKTCKIQKAWYIRSEFICAGAMAQLGARLTGSPEKASFTKARYGGLFCFLIGEYATLCPLDVLHEQCRKASEVAQKVAHFSVEEDTPY